jgi:hypothetical protein
MKPERILTRDEDLAALHTWLGDIASIEWMLSAAAKVLRDEHGIAEQIVYAAIRRQLDEAGERREWKQAAEGLFAADVFRAINYYSAKAERVCTSHEEILT